MQRSNNASSVGTVTSSSWADAVFSRPQVNDLDEFDHLTAVLKSYREVRRRSQPRPPPAALPPPPQAGRPGEDAERAPSEERAPPAGHRWATLPAVKTEIL